MKNAPSTPLARILIQELLHRPIHPYAEELIQTILGKSQPLGVLFYGSAIEKDDPDGILDFYVIVNKVSDWPGSVLKHFGNRVLPPNVEYYECQIRGQVIRAKVAIITLKQFYKMSGRYSYDITIWARFAQPARLVWVNNPKAADAILVCLIRCVKTATFWAAVLGSREGKGEAFWYSLFQKTYQAELRMEDNNRPRILLERKEERYTYFLREGWKAQNIPFQEKDGVFSPLIEKEKKQALFQRWLARSKKGKPLNLLRILKAVFTFEGGVDYVAWKIFRHQNIKITLSNFERRHPVLASPSLLYKLVKSRALKFHQGKNKG
ncbi:hypothetical protein [Entomobacter blattae]|uniref:Uncharacterized protein n=1 Tax=Entomobacter blattae TaxID=2762277 RepID=A0A7H1NP99_9PROT|nr:hypothetical protein [Entomobacter blattae]QNT77609.1 hypothetical protein JGUZn3_03580 [Entomobacter blattae]